PIQANLIYQFNPRVGFERVGFSGSSVTFSGESLLAIGAGDTEGDSAKILKRVFRQALQHKLGPKPLKSRDYFR
ncbi:MAG TPA: hypothetical protein PKZ52_06555, partial [Cellvibrionaceae bacterium]|nr:hypothetical protein [Cellvibrionaceae bacterium]